MGGYELGMVCIAMALLCVSLSTVVSPVSTIMTTFAAWKSECECRKPDVAVQKSFRPGVASRIWLNLKVSQDFESRVLAPKGVLGVSFGENISSSVSE